MEFTGFPKIARLRREIIVTEKIDGTNAQIHITETGEMIAGSRSRWITPDDDNFGFAAWVFANRDELMKLGPGSHFGEWWGQGVQRNYAQTRKRFSLFNTTRWGDASARPACCDVVPVLYAGVFDSAPISTAIERLRTHGSEAAPGFMKPEGIIVFHTAAGVGFKQTLEKDDVPKGVNA